MTRPAALEVRSVTHRFQRWGQEVIALNDVHLRIDPGEWVLMHGPNGSGKSTLLRLAGGLLQLQSGVIALHGSSTSTLSSRRLAEMVFYVHQDPLLGTAPQLTVFENLSIADQHAAGQPRRALEDRYEKLLATSSLQNRLRQPAASLSGVERQLLALHIAGLRPCETILLDEPFAALDPARAAIGLEMLRELHEAGRTLVQVTHDSGLLGRHSGTTVRMSCGEVMRENESRVSV